VSFEVFVFWYCDGRQVRVPFESVRAAFGEAAGSMEAEGFRIVSGDQEQAFVYAKPDAQGEVESVMVSRPAGPSEFWDRIVALIRLGHGLCVGDAQAVADPETVHHLPPEVMEDMEPQIVHDGASLMQVIESS
jgi:hypothetical protein